MEQLPRCVELQGHFKLADREVVTEVVCDGGDGAERVGGDGAVELSQARWVQLPAHQLQVAQLPERVGGVAEGQAGFTAGGGGGAPVVDGRHSLRGGERRR